MLIGVCLVALAVLLAVHEGFVTRARRDLKHATIARRAVLVAIAAFAVLFGERVHLLEKVQLALNSRSERAAAFEPDGDPFLARALREQRPERPFPTAGSLDDVQSWQDDLITTLRRRMEFDASPPDRVATRVAETEDVGDVRRTLIAFTSWDGTSIPAYVHEPRSAAKRGAVLVIPGHGGGIRPLSGIGRTDYQHALALALAERGFITLTAELRGFGMLAPDARSVHTTVAQAALAAGTSYKSVVVRDLAVALTVLQQWPGVDVSRLAVAGASLGGELAVLLGVLDSRPRVIISHSYGGLTGAEPIGGIRDDAEETPHGCHTIPGINRVVHREDWFRLIAPRALQVVRGADDLGRRATVDAFAAAITQPFEQLGAADRVEFSIESGGHEFFVESATRFLAKWL